MSVGEYENEPVRGLPEYLPDDETLVWQGEPDFRVMARRVFHLRSVSLYFAVLIAAHLGIQLSRGASISEVLLGSSWMIGLGLLAIGILALLAWAYARSTVYTLTDKRLVLRFGVAMPMMVNLPLKIVVSADMKRFDDGSGDIVLTLSQRKRLSYVMMWPNVRPWRFNPTQPALRSIRNVDALAAALGSVVDSPAATATSQNAGEHDRSSAELGPMLGAS